jgi:uncharacterized protein (DUF2147 family)
MFKLLFLFFISGWTPAASTATHPDLVCGKWLSTEKNLIVHVFKEGVDYKAKVVWFNSKDKSKSIEEFTDERNPDPALRNRKLLGMSILEGMDYIPKSGTWENGKIYDAKNGRHWSASAHVDKEGMLRVTGYWQFKFIGRTISFTRI